MQLTDYSFNPDKAKELLAEINYDTSQELIFVYQQPTRARSTRRSSRRCRTSGSRSSSSAGPDNAAIVEYLKDPKSWDMYIEYWSHGIDPSAELESLVICPGPYDPCDRAGFTWTPTPRYLELLKAQATELDPAKRKAQLQEIIEIVDKEQPSIGLWTEPNVYFVNKRVHGTANGIYRYGIWRFNQSTPELVARPAVGATSSPCRHGSDGGRVTGRQVVHPRHIAVWRPNA